VVKIRSKSVWKEKAEEEVYRMLTQAFGKEKIRLEPKVNGKKVDFLVETEDVYIEVYSVKDITSDITKETQYSANVDIIEIRKKKVLDRLAGKIQHESTQLPDEAKNILIIKTEDPYVPAHDVAEVFMEPILVVDRKTLQTKIKYQHSFRTDSEMMEILEKISAIIVYEKVCPHKKLCGIFLNNGDNAKFPLNAKNLSVFEGMICNECTCT